MSSVLKVYNEKKVRNYKLAFEKFSSVTEKEYKYEWAGDSLAVLWNDTTYLVSHVNDIKAQYRRYFERREYHEIYEKSCAFLWQEIINKELNWQTEDIIIDLYKEWRKFLGHQKSELKAGEQYEKVRRRSWEDLQVLFELVKVNRSKLVLSAERVNEYELIPIIAMAMVKQFGSLDEFIDMTVKYIAEIYYNVLTTGHSFEKFNLRENDESEYKAEIFYVYEANFEFRDIKYGKF